jgi:membrane protein
LPVRLTGGVFRIIDLGWRATIQAVIDFYNSSNLTYAASIGYYSLLSLFPFLLLILSVLSRITMGQSEASVLSFIAAGLPSRFDFLADQVRELGRTPLTLSLTGLIGVVVALFASFGVFGAITTAVNHAWGVNKPHGFLQHKIIAFVMLVAAGVLMLAALLLAGAVQVVEARWFTGFIARYPSLGHLSGFVYRNAATPLFVAVVGMVYYFVPNARVRLRDVWFGAVVAGLLWRAALALFSWYVRDLSRFSVHGSLAAVVVFLLWVYVSAMILLYGAQVSAAYTRLRRHLPKTAPAAEAKR